MVNPEYNRVVQSGNGTGDLTVRELKRRGRDSVTEETSRDRSFSCCGESNVSFRPSQRTTTTSRAPARRSRSDRLGGSEVGRASTSYEHREQHWT